MAAEAVGIGLAVVGLLAAFDGAVKSYTALAQIFRDDVGLQDRFLNFKRIDTQLKKWAAEYTNNGRPDEDCLVNYESKENQDMIQEILKRTTQQVEEAKQLIDKHKFDDSKAKKSLWKRLRRPRRDGTRNRVSLVLQDQDRIDSIIKQLTEHLENLEQCTKTVSALKDDNLKSIMKALTSVDAKRTHVDVRDKWAEGTCQWVFQRTEYKQWISGSTNNLLWIQATPGSGKTVLASEVIENLHASRLSNMVNIAYFYCKHDDPVRQRLAELFGCLSAQLAQQSLAFRHAFWEYTASFQKSHLANRTVEYTRLVEIFVRVSQQLERVYLVIDAADEFLPPSTTTPEDWDQREALLEELMTLQQNGKGKIKILLTSRPTERIQFQLQAVPKVVISSETNSADIELYVRSKLNKEMDNGTVWGKRLRRGESQNPTEISRIASGLVEKADGMFLFATLMLYLVLRSNVEETVSKMLGKLPSSIDKTWALLLRNIDADQQEEGNRMIIKKMLQWLVAAARPLTLLEMEAAVTLHSYGTNMQISGNRLDPQWLFQLCGPLVRLSSHQHPESRLLSLAHYSLKEYLVTGRLRQSEYMEIRKYDVALPDANAYLATVSLTYLSSQELSQPFRSKKELDQLRQKYKLLDYTTIYGGVHLSSLDRVNEKIIELLEGLLIPEVTWKELETQHRRSNTVLSMTFTFFPPPNLDDDDFVTWPARREVDVTGIPEDIRKEVVTPLLTKTQRYIESRPNCKLFLQLFRILSDSMRKDHPVNVTPLYYASLFGWKAGVEKLLEKNRDRVTISDLNHALRAAAVGGFPDVVELLVKAGADINVHIGSLGSPFQSATFCGHENVCRKLLDMGVDLQKDRPFYRPGGTVGGCMQAAAEAGNTELMQDLIHRGVDLNCNTGWLGTPLQSVLEKGKLDVARWIIKHPTFTPDVTGGYYGSASRYLCTCDGETTTDLLKAILDRDGSPSERVGPYGSLLEISSHFGHMSKVALLLEQGAQLDASSMGQFGNAVHAAAMNGDEQILQLLLNHGGNPNCPGRWLGVDEATTGVDEYGDCLVLQQGTGFLAYDHSGLTKAFFAPTMHAAMRLSEIDHNKIFLLFENEPTHRDSHLGNPLQGAAFRGNVGAMKVLIREGAHVNAVGGFFGTALQAAASQNHLEAVETLLQSGANPNVASVGYYGSALAAATALKFDEIVKALERNGGRDDCFDEDGWCARTWKSLLSQESQTKIPIDGECITPTAWSPTKQSPKLNIDKDGLGVRYVGPLDPLLHSLWNSKFIPPMLMLDLYLGDRLGFFRSLLNSQAINPMLLLDLCSRERLYFPFAATVLADHPVSPYANYYFEATIEDGGSTGIVALGLSELFIPTFKLPGHSKPSWGFRGDDGCFEHNPKNDHIWPHGASWGYHGDDGFVYAEGVQCEVKTQGRQEDEQHTDREQGGRKVKKKRVVFSTGDTVGCGIEWGSRGGGVIFWTKNGVRLEPSFPIAGRRLYPAIGLESEGAVVRANFGQRPFRYRVGDDSASDLTNNLQTIQVGS